MEFQIRFATQHSVHPTGGSHPAKMAIRYAQAFSVKSATSRTAYQRVTQAVEPTQYLISPWLSIIKKAVGNSRVVQVHSPQLELIRTSEVLPIRHWRQL